MSERKFLLLIADLDRELKQHAGLVQEAREAAAQTTDEPSGLRLRGMASVLHDFYTGIERMLERIAIELEGELPAGHDWHARLLDRMTVEIESVRPAVLSEETAQALRPYLRFRHLFRNIYGAQLRWERCRGLFGELESVSARVQQEMAQFKQVLRDLHERCR